MYQPTIGLEIHAELKTKSKMFCSCANDPNEKQANTNICPVCTAQPGTLPVINKEAVKKVIKAGLALNCSIPEHSKFDRKNYFYPDLPKGYQISQYDMPLCEKGFLQIKDKKIRITRIHLEEDTGRLIHPKDKDYSLVDFNRAGVPLMELVTEPDIKTGQQARAFAEELQMIFRYLDISFADMEKGQMRVEVNISLNKEGDKELGTKVEIKNLNSFRAVEKSIEYEIERQTEVLDNNEKVIQETRGWHDTKQITISQRIKEESHDYRYFPEPDLPMLDTKEFTKEIKNKLPEMPQERRLRFEREYGLHQEDIEVFVRNKDLGEYKKEFFKLAKICSNYIISDLSGLLKTSLRAERSNLITPENFAEFVMLIYKKEISSKIAKMVLGEMFKTGADPSHIIEDKGLSQITDNSEIEKIIKEIIKKNPGPVGDFKKGKQNAFQFLIGQIMKESKGKASPEIVNNLLKKLLT
jgi:aspartyl-tRNA(Asn)/glutamyl-tRNA(Gln) amidotransferase subunit B